MAADNWFHQKCVPVYRQATKQREIQFNNMY